MLDTNQASYILEGKSPATRDWLLPPRPGALARISAVTEAELLYGIAKSGIGEQRMRLLNWFHSLLPLSQRLCFYGLTFVPLQRCPARRRKQGEDPPVVGPEHIHLRSKERS